MHAPDCPRCQSRMELGFVIDEGYASRTATRWIEGEPVTSLWTGLKLSDRRRLDIQTWRCTRCGLLEAYAPS